MTGVELCAISVSFKEVLKSEDVYYVMNSSTSCLFHIADQALSVQKIMVMRPGELVELNTSQEL